MFDSIGTIASPTRARPSDSRPPRPSLWQRLVAWLTSLFCKEWIIERKHPEFGSVQYYDGRNPHPFVPQRSGAMKMRKAKAMRFVIVLRRSYPKYTFHVVNTTYRLSK